jgi:hypothetical protein
MRIPLITLLAAGALSLGGCAYDEFGLGYGYGSPYGYGYGSPYGYGSSYGYGGYYGTAYGYGSPYFGWYDNYYYPGTGYYVYDSYRRPHRWSDQQRTYWTSRRQAVTRSGNTTTRENWSGFRNRGSWNSTGTATTTTTSGWRGRHPHQ